ncbi:hypothetical protein OESDEN_18948 [Oesophagostomum dentatum]|uniref:Uncharacterized protein n=1 Tax=Oesophagostomum dentatum TaxID=61180 RepID=A0A0B1SBU3_OESDE|nr:hypothetical protein OESDEN_18948 [Oesophagostomum dentatum]
MLLTLDPTGAVKEYRSGKVERGTDQLMDPNRVIYFNANEYSYIQINAITCGGCEHEPKFCHSAKQDGDRAECHPVITQHPAAHHHSDQHSPFQKFLYKKPATGTLLAGTLLTN